MQQIVIGRTEEIALLKRILTNKHSDLVAIHGRRRVGKTYLIDTVYAKQIVFELSGEKSSNMGTQLKNFTYALDRYFGKAKQPTLQSWTDAFWQLAKAIDKKKTTTKKVIFLDELPWFDTPKSNFLSALEHFWNSWASKRTDIVLVICGSAASWMIKNIVNNRYGLHNRITRQLQLRPFTLKETAEFLAAKKVKFTPYQVVQIYMTVGGIPQYLNYIEPGQSVAQAIQSLFFKQNGFLTYEFDNLYQSLFEYADNHIKVILQLSKHKSGLTRTELVKKLSLKSGGGLTKVLYELEQSGFIAVRTPFMGSSYNKVFQLVDEFTIFYLKFLYQKNNRDTNWQQLSTSASYLSWCGFAFEAVCTKHIYQIKKALQIAGIISYDANWSHIATTGGAQIDLLIDRSDNTINIIEIKFYKEAWLISKKEAAAIAHKIAIFKRETKTKKLILTTVITAYGIATNQYSTELIDNEVLLDDLFS